MHKEVPPLSLAVRSSIGVIKAGEHQELEVLVGFDKRVDQTHRRFGRNVGVKLADHQQELALQLGRVRNV